MGQYEHNWIIALIAFFDNSDILEEFAILPTIENSSQRMQRLLSGCSCYCQRVGVPFIRSFGASSSIALPLFSLFYFCNYCHFVL